MFYWELDPEDMCFFHHYTRVLRFHHSTLFLHILTLFSIFLGLIMSVEV